MSNKITATNKEQMAQALGISERRYMEIASAVQEIMDRGVDILYTQIAEQVSQKLELNTNEIFFLGVTLGGYIQFRAFMNGTIQEIPEEMNVPKEMNGRPIVKTHTMAMA